MKPKSKGPLTPACPLAVLLFGIGSALAQTAPRESLLALSKHDHTLAIIDPNTLKVLARAPVGADPHEVVASTDGTTAYVSIYGSGRYHSISVIDLVAQKALPDIDTGALHGPHGLAFIGGKLWFTAEGAKAIARLDPATGKVDSIFGTGQNGTHMIYVSPDQQHIYATNLSSASVSLISGPAPQPGVDWDQTMIQVRKGDEGFEHLAGRSRTVDRECAGWQPIDHQFGHENRRGDPRGKRWWARIG